MKRIFSPEAAEFYNLINIRPGIYDFKNHGVVDLYALPAARAHSLYQAGFPFLTLREDITSSTLTPKVVTEDQPAQKDVKIHNRSNHRFVNKLLCMNFNELDFDEQSIFFNDERYFFHKKTILQDVSLLHNEMKSLHAKLKVAKSNQDRAIILDNLHDADQQRTALFKEIDTWEHDPPSETQNEDMKIKKAVADAIELERKILVTKNYVSRFNDQILNMPEDTPKRIKKKKMKLQELNKRKQFLADNGIVLRSRNK